jgi:F-type H+-transporting ATPase subunit a
MEIMSMSYISPDQVIFWQGGFITINATLVYTWLVMVLLVVGSWLVTRNLSSAMRFSRWQHFLEVVVTGIRNEINGISRGGGDHYMPFIGTLFLFIALSNILVIVPGYVAPTASLTTTAALAITVFIAVPIFGISKQGLINYLKEYFQPTFIFFPFHVMGEISRTLALAVRLFGNIMSHEKVVAILLAVTPLFFPIVMQALGLLIGMIQAYIFSILAMVYIASASQVHDEKHHSKDTEGAAADAVKT